MKHDLLKQFAVVRSSLMQERESLQGRIAEINRVLAGNATVKLPRGRRAALPPAAPVRRRRRTRVKNAMSMREAIRKVTSVKPMTRKEILVAIRKIGYKFNTKDPLNSIGVYLYNKRFFKSANGKFSPVN
jgi:hypothetical protein